MNKQVMCRTALVALGALWAGAATASDIMYEDSCIECFANISIGNTTYTCTSPSDSGCAVITMTATANTNTVTPFSVAGAFGLKNTALNSVVLTVDFFNTNTDISLNLNPSQLYVSVDQDNGGAGFSSIYGPTYPLATYWNRNAPPNNPYATYDLASNFEVLGWSPFCPDAMLCENGAPLYTTSGAQVLISGPAGPAYSAFSSKVTSVPEPATLWLLGFGLMGIGLKRKRRE